MAENEKLKKSNLVYILVYIFVPIIAIVICYYIYAVAEVIGAAAVALIFGPLVFAALWWVILGKPLYSMRTKKMEKELDGAGFSRNHTFVADGCTVIVDQENGKLAILFRWNPFRYYVFPASRISKTWVNDGKTGTGIFAGSSRVSFLFLVDGIKIRVNTFISNRRWAMDHKYILEGISKADMMVEVLNDARGN